MKQLGGALDGPITRGNLVPSKNPFAAKSIKFLVVSGICSVNKSILIAPKLVSKPVVFMEDPPEIFELVKGELIFSFSKAQDNKNNENTKIKIIFFISLDN